MRYALIQILGDGDDIKVTATSDDPIQLMVRAKEEAESCAKFWQEDLQMSDPDHAATRPRVTTAFYGQTKATFEAHVRIEDLAQEWQVSAIAETL